MEKWTHLFFNGTVITAKEGSVPIERGAVAIRQGKIAWVGKVDDLPPYEVEEASDVGGRLITPGLIDCHTHLVFASNRAHEFALRLQGISYEEIARQGGGIQSTVAKTRLKTVDELVEESLPRAKALLASGVTTVEIKSGYGLSTEAERNILLAARKLGDHLPWSVSTTFLGAHATPLEYKGKEEAYIDLVCGEMIPLVAREKLADAVDVFCEKIAFTPKQTERVFAAAKAHGLPIKCHAEQLSESGGAILAARHFALSADHLEYLTEEGVLAMKKSNTVAVLLPGAYYFLREKKAPPIDLLRRYHVAMAVATDCNPGTSPLVSLPLAMQMACTLFRLTPQEALLGTTRFAAQALGLLSSCGTLTPGKKGDVAVWDVGGAEELVYYMGHNPLAILMQNGQIV